MDCFFIWCWLSRLDWVLGLDGLDRQGNHIIIIIIIIYPVMTLLTRSYLTVILCYLQDFFLQNRENTSKSWCGV